MSGTLKKQLRLESIHKMKAYLLDTHTLLWATGETARLSKTVKNILQDASNRVMVSHASIWELSIKQNIGKIDLPADYFQELSSLGYEMLHIKEEHLAAYRPLPLIHRDPFDRMLVSQAQVDDLTLLSQDPEIRKYKVKTLW